MPAYATDNSSGYDLGLEYDSSDCFDNDYYVSTWRQHVAGTPLVGAQISMAPASVSSSLEASFAALDPEARAAAEDEYRLLKNEHASKLRSLALVPGKSVPKPAIETLNRKIMRIDCAKVCKDSSDFRCLANAPPQGDKIASLRDKILAVHTGSYINTIDLLHIFNIQNDVCSRGAISVNSQSSVKNDGNICAYPLLLESDNTSPIAAIHVGHNMDGEAIVGSGGSSIMFYKRYASPVFVFKKKNLNNDFGGTILEMSADSTAVYMNTDRGCVEMRVQP